MKVGSGPAMNTFFQGSLASFSITCLEGFHSSVINRRIRYELVSIIFS